MNVVEVTALTYCYGIRLLALYGSLFAPCDPTGVRVLYVLSVTSMALSLWALWVDKYSEVRGFPLATAVFIGTLASILFDGLFVFSIRWVLQ
jgi:hypothetical protein